jgi:hypothetical protein
MVLWPDVEGVKRDTRSKPRVESGYPDGRKEIFVAAAQRWTGIRQGGIK